MVNFKIFITGILTFFVGCFLYSAPDKSIIAIDWPIAETLAEFNYYPIGVGDKIHYNNWVEYPFLPDSVLDVGTRGTPNTELIRQLQPDILIISSWYSDLFPKFVAKYSPNTKLKEIDFFTDRGISWDQTVYATKILAATINQFELANHLIIKTEQLLENYKEKLKQQKFERPIAVVMFIDDRHLRIYGQNSLYDEVFKKLGIVNAWQKKNTNNWGYSTITMAQLAELPKDTMLFIIKPYPVFINTKLENNSIWAYLPFSQKENYRILPAVWSFGALPTMQRFAHITFEALTSEQKEFF